MLVTISLVVVERIREQRLTRSINKHAQVIYGLARVHDRNGAKKW